METASLLLLLLGAIAVLLVLSFALVASIIIKAARSGHIRARGGLKAPGVSLEGEIDASSKK